MLRVIKKSSMPLYEENYLRLTLILPDLKSKNSVIVRNKSLGMELSMSVIERFKYTTTIQLKMAPISRKDLLPDCVMVVRLCHDAEVAEVISFQGQQRLKPVYDYPNSKMFHPDEKRQTNNLLCDFLSFCNKKGLIFCDDESSHLSIINW